MDTKKALLNNHVSAYQAKLIANNEHGKVIDYLRKELLQCNTFYFSVAFITASGLNLLLLTLKELEERGYSGKILTSSYLFFNKPSVFRWLYEIKNIEVKVTEKDFHSKGYIFDNEGRYSVLIGSSNLTKPALTKNTEWNMSIKMSNKQDVYREILDEFWQEWEQANDLTINWINDYEKIYRIRNRKASFNKFDETVDLEYLASLSEPEGLQIDIDEELVYKKIEPNKMQQKALKNLQELRLQGSDRALIISATGTGKTYLAAFDVKVFQPKRMLFLAHRERLLKDACLSFLKILGNGIKTGYYVGNERNETADFLFASVSTLNKEEHLSKFSRNYFDYIIVDEVHHIGANSYQKIMEYFNPTFLLGMTATPERTDDYDVFRFFDYKIGYEIRLQDALEQDMLCPFHYFGISDISVDGTLIDEYADFNNLVSDRRIHHILDTVQYYGYSGERVRGLIFCSRVDEATFLSKKLNENGLRTVALAGNATDEIRESTIQRLEQDEEENALDYIVTVDIFNEGIDIPAVNQILMLRETKSSIVFIQQLGRGLRKYKDKEYVTIIDFIGNYDNNFLIPVALSGDISYNKDNLRRFIFDPSSIISGNSSVEFDHIVKEKIYKAINFAKFTETKFIKDQYNLLKKKIGHIPSHMDFITYESIDLQNIIIKYDSYIKFLISNEKAYTIAHTQCSLDIFNFISTELSNGKRIHELAIIKLLLDHTYITYEQISGYLNETYFLDNQEEAIQSAINFLLGGFLRNSEWKKYNLIKILQKESDCYYFDSNLLKIVEDEFVRNEFIDLISYSEEMYKDKYVSHYKETSFTLYRKYTRKDVCRLLNWDINEVALNIGGYKYNAKHNNMCVYVTYEKDEDISESIKYEDRFVDDETIICISKAKRTYDSKDMKIIREAKHKGMKIHLFMNRLKEEKEFYYLGEIEYTGNMEEIARQNGDSVVEIEYKLDTPVKYDVYNYLTNR